MDRLLSIWTTTAVWLLVHEDHLIPECVVFHGRTTVSVTAAFPLPVHTCGTIFPRTFDKPIWVTNISNGSWKLICLEITAHCDFFIFAPLILLLTYLSRYDDRLLSSEIYCLAYLPKLNHVYVLWCWSSLWRGTIFNISNAFDNIRYGKLFLLIVLPAQIIQVLINFHTGNYIRTTYVWHGTVLTAYFFTESGAITVLGDVLSPDLFWLRYPKQEWGV